MVSGGLGGSNAHSLAIINLVTCGCGKETDTQTVFSLEFVLQEEGKAYLANLGPVGPQVDCGVSRR